MLGHIDGVGTIVKKSELEGSRLYMIEVSDHLSEFLVEIGSVAVDGISLTIARLENNVLTISIIPFTLKHTTLADKKISDKVNIETDIIGKYVKKFVEKKEKVEKISPEWLEKLGF